MSKLISLIIPLYNVEQYIEQCLVSIIKQINEQIEVIIVNDGSQDNSLQIVEDTIKKINDTAIANNFRILHQSNQGQSVARNNALTIAQGQYIAFLDSDDLLADNYFQQLMPILQAHQPDIVRFKYSTFTDLTSDKAYFDIYMPQKNLTMITDEILKGIFNDMKWFSFINVYKKELFIDELFPKNVYFEDVILMSKIFTKAKTIYFLNESLYLYRIHQNSSIRNSSIQNIRKLESSHRNLLNNLVERVKHEPIYSPIISAFSFSYIGLLLKQKKFKEAFLVHKDFLRYRVSLDPTYITEVKSKNYYEYGLSYVFLTIFKRLKKSMIKI